MLGAECKVVLVVVFVVLGAIVGVAAIIAIVLFATRDDDSESNAGRTPLEGFDETRVSVKAPTSTLIWCMLLAATTAASCK